MTTKGWVYTLKDNGVVVYVGQTAMKNGVKKRVHAHKKNKDFDTICAREVSIENLTKIETMLIAKYRPKHNKKLYGGETHKTRAWIVNSISKNITAQVRGLVNEHLTLKPDSYPEIISLNGNEYCQSGKAHEIVKIITDGIDVAHLNQSIAKSVTNRELFNVVLSGCVVKKLSESIKPTVRS